MSDERIQIERSGDERVLLCGGVIRRAGPCRMTSDSWIALLLGVLIGSSIAIAILDHVRQAFQAIWA